MGGGGGGGGAVECARKKEKKKMRKNCEEHNRCAYITQSYISLFRSVRGNSAFVYHGTRPDHVAGTMTTTRQLIIARLTLICMQIPI